MPEPITSFLIGLVSGLLSSLAIWRYSTYLKPQFKVSKSILTGANLSNRNKYYIGIRNHGKRQIINIRAQCQLLTKGNISIGTETTAEMLPLKTDYIFALSRKSKNNDIWAMTDNFNFTIVLKGKDLREMLINENAGIEFIVSATDSLSGMTLVKSMSYTVRDLVMSSYEDQFYSEFM